jgi:hypothetical protein
MYGSCPALLAEPQRTNLFLRSEEFDNASWTKNNSSITANSTTSPKGTSDADTLTGNGTSAAHAVTQSVSVSASTVYTVSIYAKKNTNDFIQIAGASALISINSYANFDLNNGTVGTVGSSATATIQSVGDGWYRCTMTATTLSTATSGSCGYYLISSATSSRLENNTLSTSVYLFGSQFEQGAYPTTYIPTTTASATRVADSASKTGVSSLIGQTEGVMYWEGRIIQGVPTDLLIIGTTQDSVFFNLTTTPSLRVGVRANNTLVINATSSTLSGTYFKIAVAYKSGDIVAYVNGTQVFTNTQTFTFSGAISEIEIGRPFFDSKATQFNQKTALFPTRLTNSQLASLTTL